MQKKIIFRAIVAGLLALPAACKKPNLEITPAAGSIGTISNYLKTNFDLSLFYAAIQRAGLADSLDRTDGAYTLLAPVNTAFHKDSIYSATDLDKWPTDSLKTFVRNHILPTKLFYTDIPQTADNLYKNMNGADLYFSDGGNFPLTVNGVVVQQSGSLVPNASAYGTTLLNGVVYPLVNTLKVSKGTVQDLIASMPKLSHLEAGLKKFGLWDRLSGEGPFTVVAPQDTAFESNGLTLDSIGRLDPARYDPVLFGIYSISPNHIFITDLVQLVSDQSEGVGFPSISDSLVLMLNVNGYDMYLLSASVALAPYEVNKSMTFIGPTASTIEYQPNGTYLLGEYMPGVVYIQPSTPPNGKYINYACSNGVLHLLSGILLRPSDVAIH